MNQEEMEEMRLLNGFSDGLFDGFLHRAKGTTTIVIEKNENLKTREEERKGSKEANIYRWGVNL